MLTSSIALAMLCATQGDRHSVFLGGTVPEFARFVKSQDAGALVLVTQLDCYSGVGPSWCVRQEAETGPRLIWGPRYPNQFTIENGKVFFAVIPKIYARTDVGLPLVSFGSTPAEKDAEIAHPYAPFPMMEGEFWLKNGLKRLGLNVRVHPFFANMRVYLNTPTGKALDAWRGVARVVGGKIVELEGGKGYALEPDYAAIRARAIATWDTFAEPQQSQLAHPVLILRNLLIRTLPAKSWQRLVDAGREEFAEALQPGDIYDYALARYRELRAGMPQAEQSSWPERPAIDAVFGPNLGAGFRVKNSSGAQLGF